MKNEEVKIRVQKYFEGETTLEEERLLADFFMHGPVPEELLPYREWFAGFAEELKVADGFVPDSGDEIFTAGTLAAMIAERNHQQKVGVRSLRYTLMGIAASLLVAMGAMLWYQQQPDYRDTFDNPEQALAVAEETLGFVSARYNKGLGEMAVIQQLSESVRPATENLAILQRGFKKADLFLQEVNP